MRVTNWRHASGGSRLLRLAGVAVATTAVAGLGIAHPQPARAATTSSSVAYLTDPNTNGGQDLFADAFKLANPVSDGGTYSTATPASALTVTMHIVNLSAVDTPTSAVLTTGGYDTLVVWQVCQIQNHPNALLHINQFLDAGHKLIILDGGNCNVDAGGLPDWTGFENPFKAFSQTPAFGDASRGSFPYTFVESSSLTGSLPDCGAAGCNEPGNSVTDANILQTNQPGWCESIGGTTYTGVSGPLEAYSRNKNNSGLAVYEGEAFANSLGATQNAAESKHLRLVYDDALTQGWNTDGLPCSSPVGSSPPVAETHLAVLAPVSGLGVVVIALIGTFAWRRRRATVSR